MSHVRVIHLLETWHRVDCVTTSERFGSCYDCDINARGNFSERTARTLHEFIGLHGTRSMEYPVSGIIYLSKFPMMDSRQPKI